MPLASPPLPHLASPAACTRGTRWLLFNSLSTVVCTFVGGAFVHAAIRKLASIISGDETGTRALIAIQEKAMGT